MLSSRIALLALAISPLVACDVFDASLYQSREGGADGGTPPGGGGDGSVASLELADRCDGPVAAATPNVPGIVDTRNLANDIDQTADCTGTDSPGNDGFISVDMTAGEKWHFHVRAGDQTVDPTVYVLASCDPRSCRPGAGLDECGPGLDEHVSFVAPASARYLVGVDTVAPGGGVFELLVIHPTCGNGGALEHSESCDDGNTMPGDGCDALCRVELSEDNATEIEPNDDHTNANVVMFAAAPMATGVETKTVRGKLGGKCDFDMWAIVVPEGGSLTARVLDGNGAPCAVGAAPNMSLVFIQPDGRTTIGMGRPGEANGCPELGADDVFAQRLPAGEYYVRVTIVDAAAPTFDYRLQLGLAR